MMSRRSLPWPSFVSSHEPAQHARWEGLVAFRDCDPMGVLWHGNYLAYCEAARHHLASTLGVGVEWLMGKGFYAPIIRCQVMHLRAIKAERPIVVEAMLYPTAQVRLYHRYHIHVDDQLCAIAETEQTLTDLEFNLILQQPPEMAAMLGGNQP